MRGTHTRCVPSPPTQSEGTRPVQPEGTPNAAPRAHTSAFPLNRCRHRVRPLFRQSQEDTPRLHGLEPLPALPCPWNPRRVAVRADAGAGGWAADVEWHDTEGPTGVHPCAPIPPAPAWRTTTTPPPPWFATALCPLPHRPTVPRFARTWAPGRGAEPVQIAQLLAEDYAQAVRQHQYGPWRPCPPAAHRATRAPSVSQVTGCVRLLRGVQRRRRSGRQTTA